MVSLPGIHEMFSEFLQERVLPPPRSNVQREFRPFEGGRLHTPADPQASGRLLLPPLSRTPTPSTDTLHRRTTLPHDVYTSQTRNREESHSRSCPPNGRRDVHIRRTPTLIPMGVNSTRSRDVSSGYSRPSSSPSPDPIRTVESMSYSFDILRSDPTSSSLEHISSSTTLDLRGSASVETSSAAIACGAAPSFRVPVSSDAQPLQGYTGLVSFSGVSGSDGVQETSSRLSIEEGSSRTSVDPLRRHPCPHCSKSFNRPSTLRTHINTHTGEKPYECPYPNCDRRFNVNSNMRRHFRTHGRGLSSLPNYAGTSFMHTPPHSPDDSEDELDSDADVEGISDD